MSYSSDYTITTLSRSVAQRPFDAGVEGTQAPFAFGGNWAVQTLRNRSTPYRATAGAVPPNLAPTSDDPTFPTQNINAGHISSTSTVHTAGLEYIPTLYTQVISASKFQLFIRKLFQLRTQTVQLRCKLVLYGSMPRPI